MNRDKIYEDLDFSTEFSVDDWNSLIELKLAKYFEDESIFKENKEILRTEVVNYIRISIKPEYLKLFDWTFDQYSDCLEKDRDKTLAIFSNSFHEVSNTDMKWMTNVLTQADFHKFSERDKINYYFKIIDETLESTFNPRFRLFDQIINFKVNNEIIDNSNSSFGNIISNFPIEFKEEAQLYLNDPLFSISTNQWRNIASHKSFSIKKNSIDLVYGRSNNHFKNITYDDFYKIITWTQDIYRVIRLSQVLISLNLIQEILPKLNGKEELKIRFESNLFHIVHNMQIVGFKFVSTEETDSTFNLNVNGKLGHKVSHSLIHASLCLDQLSCAIYDDDFVRDNFEYARISIVDNEGKKLASATVKIKIALKRANNEISQDEYLKNIKFEV